MRIERDLVSALKPFIITTALPKVIALLRQDGVKLALSSRKNRVLGYYCPPKTPVPPPGHPGSGFDSLHTISLQVDLNPYALLFVFVHEWAHLLTRKQHGNKAAPHGKEWKQNFKNLFEPFHSTTIFPADILQTIDAYFVKTSAYFEARLEDACNRYGKNRKEFARTYMGLLRQGQVIPAPYMGRQAEILLDSILQERREQEETEQSRRIERLQKELDLEKAKKASVPQAVSLGFLPVSRLEAGSRIRIDGKEYLVEEQSRPLIRLKDPDSGQESRIHFLLQVEALAYPPDIPPSKLPGKGYCPEKESHSTCK